MPSLATLAVNGKVFACSGKYLLRNGDFWGRIRHKRGQKAKGRSRGRHYSGTLEM